MTRILTIAAALLATPTFAHDGAHLHPHGIETAWGLLGLGVLAVGAVLMLRAMRR